MKLLSIQESLPLQGTESALSFKENFSQGISPWIELIHAVITKNNIYYPPDKLHGEADFEVNGKKMPTGIYSLLDPYPKPILSHHDELSDAVGRVEKVRFSENTRAGSPGVLIQARISDERAIQKVKDGRYLTVSAGISTDGARCSICGTDQLLEGFCEHEKGVRYDGKLAYWTAGNIWFKEASFVNVPGDVFAQVIDVGDSPFQESLKENEKPGRIVISNSQVDEPGSIQSTGAFTIAKEASVLNPQESYVQEILKKAALFGEPEIAESVDSWNAASAIGRVREWATGPDGTVHWARYRKAFFWYNEKEPENFGSYKLCFADVIDGKLMAIPKGILSAAESLENREDIPFDEFQKIRKRISLYYSKIGKEIPWKDFADLRQDDLMEMMSYSQATYGANLLTAYEDKLTYKTYQELKRGWQSHFAEREWKLPKSLLS